MEGQNDSSDGNPPGTTPEAEVHASNIPPIAGFWRRVVAFLIDGAVLGILGQVLGWSMSSFWFQIGPYGRLIGLAIALAYFGVMGSRIAGGATLGKRLLGIAVRDAAGRPIGIMRSIARTSVWLVPLTLNGWALPILSNPIASRVAAVVLFGVGGAVLLTMALNRRTRQGLHDVLAGTYVLRMSGPAVAAYPAAGRLPWVLSAAMVIVAVVLISAGEYVFSRFAPQLQTFVSLQQKLQSDNRFFSAGVVDSSFHESGGKVSRILRVQVWYKGNPNEVTRTRVMNDIARATLTLPDLERFDLILIEVKSAYDLGIAKGYLNHRHGQPVSVWRDRVTRESTSR